MRALDCITFLASDSECHLSRIGWLFFLIFQLILGRWAGSVELPGATADAVLHITGGNLWVK